MKVVLVYNKGSGGYSSHDELLKAFADAAIEVTESIKLNDNLAASLKPHIKTGGIIAVVGGDGSINAVARLLTNTDAILMPLPGGTLNHFTKDLGIPQSLPDALEYFKSAKKIKIDTGQVDRRAFINNSSVGIYSDSLLVRDEHEKSYGKWPAMIISSLVVFFRFRTYQVSLNGKNYSTPLVFVGNNRYTREGFSFRRSQLNEGILSVYIVIGKSRINLFWAMIGLIFGKKHIAKKLRSFDTKEVIISTNKSIRVSLDGEHEKMRTPLKYTVNAASLNVLRAANQS